MCQRLVGCGIAVCIAQPTTSALEPAPHPPAISLLFPHHQMEDMKGKIRVYCRVRPVLKMELDRGQTGEGAHCVVWTGTFS